VAHIFSFLPEVFTLKEFLPLQAVCNLFYRLCQEDKLWRGYCEAWYQSNVFTTCCNFSLDELFSDCLEYGKLTWKWLAQKTAQLPTHKNKTLSGTWKLLLYDTLEIGQIKKGQLSDFGILIHFVSQNYVRKWIGTFGKGQLQGRGIYLSQKLEIKGDIRNVSTKISYEGDFKYNTFHGKGVKKILNGKMFCGDFKYGKYHGMG